VDAQAFFIFLKFVSMSFYCHLPVVPMRREPSDRSEQISQLLYGESISVLDKQAKWSLVKGEDDYEGWIDNKQYSTHDSEHLAWVTEQVQKIETPDGPMLVPHGSLIPGRMNSQPYNPKSLEATGRLYLNTPYLWGGKSIFGIDCSGLMQQIFKMYGKKLPRDAWQQAELGDMVHLVAEARAGDLAFFDNAEGRIVHVGLLLNESEILHASGQVRIDLFDHQGIFNKANGQYSHQLRIIRRLKT